MPLMLMLGLSRPSATEFSFLVGIPTMLAAGGLKIFQALHHPPTGGAPERWDMVLLGFITSAVVSFIAAGALLHSDTHLHCLRLVPHRAGCGSFPPSFHPTLRMFNKRTSHRVSFLFGIHADYR